ncbi:Secondary metabolism regulator LAE1 [Metarhizium anisopliae]
MAEMEKQRQSPARILAKMAPHVNPPATSNTKCANSSSTGDSASPPSNPPNTSSTSPQAQAYGPSNTVLLPQQPPPLSLSLKNLTDKHPLQAKNNPQAHVIGTDLFTMQPAATAAPNVSFIRQDVEKEEWKYPHPLDYIHLRYIVSCFDDAQSVLRKAHAALRPGGHIEIFDIVLRPRYAGDKRARALDNWCAAVCAAAAREGRDMQKAEKYKRWLEEIGFVDVVDVELVVPGNAWPEDDRMREIGRHLVQVQPGPLLSLGSYFGPRDLSGVLDGLAPDMLRDMEDESIRLCWPM